MAERVVQEAAIGKLVCPPQVRTSSGLRDDEIAGLAQSIAEVGIIQPLLVREDRDVLIVTDGERRLRAARKLGLTTVPVIVDQRGMSEADVMHRQLVLDAQRVRLNPIERGRAMNRLMTAMGWSGKQIADKLGLGTGTVSRALAVLVLPEEVQQQVAAGRLPYCLIAQLKSR